MSRFEVKVPAIGDYQDVPVIEVLVKDGERVEKDAALITLESEKATMEVPAPQAGIVRAIRVKTGDKVSEGAVILSLETEAAAAPAPKPEAPKPAPAPAPPKPAPARAPDTAAPAVATSTTTGAPRNIEVTVPDIGDYHDVPVIEVLVKDGDSVEKDAPLIVLESEKATMEVPAPASGTVRGLKLKAGARVSKGSAVCSLETRDAHPAPSAGMPKPAPDIGPKEEQQPPPKPTRAPPPPAYSAVSPAASAPADSAPPWVGQAAKGEIPHASPAVRRLAREFGVDLARVSGTGPKGRILTEDVQAFTRKALAGAVATAPGGGAGIPPIPAQDFSLYGTTETKPLSRIRKLSAQYLHRAWLNIPHVTQTDEADITDLESFRKAQSEETGTKLTLLPFIMKAVAAVLKQFPDFNSSLAPDGESLIIKKYCHIGFAADTEAGLVVPVVRDVWNKGIVQLAHDCGDLAKKARDGKLKPDEMKGGCFSISSLGGIGGSHFTPIVNAPEVAILGVSRSQMKPNWNGREFVPRLMCPLSLSYDHRVIDGAQAARFIVALSKSLADLRRLTL